MMREANLWDRDHKLSGVQLIALGKERLTPCCCRFLTLHNVISHQKRESFHQRRFPWAFRRRKIIVEAITKCTKNLVKIFELKYTKRLRYETPTFFHLMAKEAKCSKHSGSNRIPSFFFEVSNIFTYFFLCTMSKEWGSGRTDFTATSKFKTMNREGRCRVTVCLLFKMKGKPQACTRVMSW